MNKNIIKTVTAVYTYNGNNFSTKELALRALFKVKLGSQLSLPACADAWAAFEKLSVGDFADCIEALCENRNIPVRLGNVLINEMKAEKPEVDELEKICSPDEAKARADWARKERASMLDKEIEHAKARGSLFSTYNLETAVSKTRRELSEKLERLGNVVIVIEGERVQLEKQREALKAELARLRIEGEQAETHEADACVYERKTNATVKPREPEAWKGFSEVRPESQSDKELT